MDDIRYKIMLVDDNMSNLNIGRAMLKDYYEVFPIPSGAKLFQVLERVTPALILLDIMMPEMDGFEVIKKLKEDPRWSEIPVIFLTSKSDEHSELEGLSLGAIDYVAKPFSAPLLLQRIRNHLLLSYQKKELKKYSENLEVLVEAKTQEVTELQHAIIATLADTLETRDDETGGHVARTQKYLQVMVDRLLETGIYANEMESVNVKDLINSALLHDIGKIGISDTILRKPGPLDPAEFEEMKKHARLGGEIIERISSLTSASAFLKHAKNITLSHHEKWDGTGYPNGLAGYDIPIEGRLMAIADVYDALISDRPYKKAFTMEKAAEIIVLGRGKHFDPLLVDIFVELQHKFEEVVKDINGTLGSVEAPLVSAK
ncbi:MAG: response regulator [Deltaproteobacteria bacterium]|jgi:putative two-component system response regulator|nr:response regulator [Deltaproteobacteria bacterium]